MASASNKKQTAAKKLPPAHSLERKENQMILLAMELAEEQLRDGTASSQVVTHYLKLASTREKDEREKRELEKEKLQRENELLRARTESLASTARIEELYSNALVAFSSYRGDDSYDD